MFILKYMGSTLQVSEPSTIRITPNGVEVTPLEAKLLSTMSQAEVAKLDILGDVLVKKGLLKSNAGRKIDPNSVRRRVITTIEAYLEGKEYASRQDILAHVQEQCPDLTAKQIANNAQDARAIRNNGIWSPICSLV